MIDPKEIGRDHLSKRNLGPSDLSKLKARGLVKAGSLKPEGVDSYQDSVKRLIREEDSGND